MGDSEVKRNLLEFFEYLKESEAEYTYKILKDFAEREKTKYLSSNLVDFMNELSRNRRRAMFNEVWSVYILLSSVSFILHLQIHLNKTRQTK